LRTASNGQNDMTLRSDNTPPQIDHQRFGRSIIVTQETNG
jgi:hypothetical protein